MTKTTSQAAAAVLSALMSLAIVAGMNGLATAQYAKADSVVMAAASGQPDVTIQRVTVIGHRADA